MGPSEAVARHLAEAGRGWGGGGRFGQKGARINCFSRCCSIACCAHARMLFPVEFRARASAAALIRPERPGGSTPHLGISMVRPPLVGPLWSWPQQTCQACRAKCVVGEVLRGASRRGVGERFDEDRSKVPALCASPLEAAPEPARGAGASHPSSQRSCMDRLGGRRMCWMFARGLPRCSLQEVPSGFAHGRLTSRLRYGPLVIGADSCSVPSSVRLSLVKFVVVPLASFGLRADFPSRADPPHILSAARHNTLQSMAPDGLSDAVGVSPRKFDKFSPMSAEIAPT